jgi:syndecan 1
VNEYKSTEKSSKDYTPIDTENKTNYKARPIASPADYLSTFNSKPSNEKIDSSKIFAAVAENFKTGVHTADGSSENEGDYSAIPGEPGTDYPIFSELPNDQFNCSEQRLPGYYADVSARCQVFHICLGDRQWSFLCPNGTIFSQEHFVCVWWYEFDCSKATSLYDLNEKLFVISSTEQSTEGENEENKQYGESSAISEISKKSDQDYRSSKTNKEESIVAY